MQWQIFMKIIILLNNLMYQEEFEENDDLDLERFSENSNDFNDYFNEISQELEIFENSNQTSIDSNKSLKELEIKERENQNPIRNSFLNKKIENSTQFKSERKFQLTDDNIRKHCKQLLLNNLLNFINNKILELYNYKNDNIFNIKQLKNLNYKIKSETKIKYDIAFLDKTIGEIFSDKISQKITNFPPFHNQIIIKNLLNEENEGIKNYFIKLFNLTFFQCLEHFRGTYFHEELNGMNVLEDELRENNLEENEYKENFEYYFLNYEYIIKNKKPRNKGKSKKILFNKF